MLISASCTARNSVVSTSRVMRGKASGRSSSTVMPLRLENPSTYQRRADTNPASSRNGGWRRYESVPNARHRSFGEIDALAQGCPRLIRQDRLRTRETAQLHFQRCQILRCRLVQHLRDPPSLVILCAHQPRGEGAQLHQRLVQLALGFLSRRDVGIDDDGTRDGPLAVTDGDRGVLDDPADAVPG